jgi:hypothetical protein
MRQVEEVAYRQRRFIKPPPPPTPPVSVPDPTPDRPVGGSWLDGGFGEGIAGIGALVAIFVVAFIVLYLFYLFIGVILGNEITAIVVLGVGLFVFCLRQWDHDSIAFNLPIVLAYVLLFVFVVWASGADRPPPDLGEECRIEDRGGRIREVCW